MKDVTAKICKTCGVKQALSKFPFRCDINAYRHRCKSCKNVRSKHLRNVRNPRKPVPDLDGEVWGHIKGWQDLYEISNKGRVKNKLRGLIMPGTTPWGYNQYFLSRDSITYPLSAHRLVAQAFLPNPENKPQVNHINGVKNDNRVENLEWCTRVENAQHAIKLGLYKRTINVQTVNTIWELRDTGLSYNKIASRLGIADNTVRSVLLRISWKHLVKNEQGLWIEP